MNMDPANEGLPYSCGVDISELVTLDDVMEGLKLGPNGGLLYSMEYVEANLDWLENKLKQHSDCYFLFDCPGQVELYTHQSSVKNIFSQLAKWNFRVSFLKSQAWEWSLEGKVNPTMTVQPLSSHFMWLESWVKLCSPQKRSATFTVKQRGSILLNN